MAAVCAAGPLPIIQTLVFRVCRSSMEENLGAEVKDFEDEV